MIPNVTTKIQRYKRTKSGFKLVDYIPKPIKEPAEEEIAKPYFTDEQREKIRLRLKCEFINRLCNQKQPLKRNYSQQQIANKLENG